MLVRLVMFLGLAFAASAADQIYRTVDEDGNVVFTDVPPANSQGKPEGREISVPSPNTYEPAAGPAAPTASDAPATPAAASPYDDLTIVDPTNEQTIRQNNGDILIQAVVDPPLQSDHRLLLTFDGAPTDLEAEGGIFQLSNVDRGTHTAAARVVDANNEVVMESDPVTFTLQRYHLPTPTPTPHRNGG
jgi:Domain of unknown function (DUF4124)